MANPTVYMTTWCPYCRALLRDLRAFGVEFDQIDVDADDEAAALVESLNNGNRTVPTVVFADGSHLTNPSAAVVSAKVADALDIPGSGNADDPTPTAGS